MSVYASVRVCVWWGGVRAKSRSMLMCEKCVCVCACDCVRLRGMGKVEVAKP